MLPIRVRRRDGFGRRAAALVAPLTVAFLVATACGTASSGRDTAQDASPTVPVVGIASASTGEGPPLSDAAGPAVTAAPRDATASPGQTSVPSTPAPRTEPPVTRARASSAPTAAQPASTTAASPASTTAVGPPKSEPAPVSVRLPSIDVDEQLIDLGIALDGSAQVPRDYDRAGWFAAGGRPGAIGPTVILGHVDSLDGPAVFYRLRELAVDDTAEVGLADGTVASYRVTAVERFNKDDFPTFAVYGATLLDVVRFITCGGPFDDEALSYTENVVVTAVRI